MNSAEKSHDGSLITVICVRHCQSAANAGEATRDPATIPLMPLGGQQALLLASSLSITPTLIVSSPYSRAEQTALPLRQRFPAADYEVWPVQEFTYLSPRDCGLATATQRLPLVAAYWDAAGRPSLKGENADMPGISGNASA